MHIEEHVSLEPYNTFGISARARYFLPIRDLETLRAALKRKDLPEPFILSGGSNILLKGDLNALVLYMDTRGKEVVWEDANRIRLKVMGGEPWHALVLWTLEQGYGGLENLSLIPGKTGTAPIQNIGAYGVELKDVFHSCEAIRLRDGHLEVFDRKACGFGYRDSVFKRQAKGKYLIWSVTLELTRSRHTIRTDYGAIRAELEAMGVRKPGPGDVSKAVIAIRSRKLPDPAKLGNSGSFFKNPVIPAAQFESLKAAFPELPGYPAGVQGETEAAPGVKVPAGWLIDALGLKGTRRGDAGIHKNQALVLVNYGNASGTDILNLAMEVQNAVFERFAIRLEPEVNILP